MCDTSEETINFYRFSLFVIYLSTSCRGQSSLMLLCPTKLCIREGSIHWPRMCTCQRLFERLFELLTKLLHCLVSLRASPTIPSPTIPYLLYMSISLTEVLYFAEHLGIYCYFWIFLLFDDYSGLHGFFGQWDVANPRTTTLIFISASITFVGLYVRLAQPGRIFIWTSL